jgi:hypothetical protein
MAVARCFGVVALALVAAGAADAQTCTLAETPRANDCYQIQMGMTLAGEMSVVQEGKPVKLKLAATAEHRFRERVLAVPAQGAGVTKAARYYDDARATITVDGTASPRTVRRPAAAGRAALLLPARDAHP